MSWYIITLDSDYKKVDLLMTWMKMMLTLATIIVKAETRTNATRMRMTTMTMMKPPAMKICMHCSFSHSLGIGEQLCRLLICINSWPWWWWGWWWRRRRWWWCWWRIWRTSWVSAWLWLGLRAAIDAPPLSSSDTERDEDDFKRSFTELQWSMWRRHIVTLLLMKKVITFYINEGVVI